MYANISRPINPVVAECLQHLSQCATKLGLEFIVVGASARDLIFRNVFGIDAPRATLDVDLGIKVESWDRLREFTNALIGSKRFTQDNHTRHRLVYYQSGLPVDLIPFGGLESPKGAIAWPPDGSPAMSTFGFAEALESSVKFKVGGAADVVVNLATPPAMACMKFIAWGERPEERATDAADILFMAKYYGDAGNESALYDMAANEGTDESFDYEIASAKLLGRHMKKIASGETIAAVLRIIRKAVNEGEYSRFVLATVPAGSDADFHEAKHARLVKAILEGIESD